MTTYTAIASRTEGCWHIRVPGLGTRPDYGITTQATSLKRVEPMARDLIAVYVDVPDDSFDVDVKVDLPPVVRQHLSRAASLRSQAASANSKAADEHRAAARALQAQGLSTREIGRLLDVSHQRAHQLVS